MPSLARPFLLAVALLSTPAAAQPVRIDVAPTGLPADGPSVGAIVSFDGRYVAFTSSATNLVAGATANSWNLYRYDRQAGTLSRATMRPRRFEGFPRITAISHDGRLVLFSSFDEDFVDGDVNDTGDVFQYDFTTGETRRVSVASSGAEANGGSDGDSMSADGRYVVFTSQASNLGPPEIAPAPPYRGNIFVHDTVLHQTVQVTAGAGNVPLNGGVVNGRISPDGEWVVFATSASNLAGAPHGGRFATTSCISCTGAPARCCRSGRRPAPAATSGHLRGTPPVCCSPPFPPTPCVAARRPATRSSCGTAPPA